MAQVLADKVVYCLKCKKFISYTKEDIKKGEHVYYVYGCEENYAPYKFINCPKCGKEIEIDKNKIILVKKK